MSGNRNRNHNRTTNRSGLHGTAGDAVGLFAVPPCAMGLLGDRLQRRRRALFPFRGDFNPSKKCPFAVVPANFVSADQYFATMERNVVAELAAAVRQAKSTSLRGIIRNISDNNTFDAWIEIADNTRAEQSLSKTLLRLEGAGSWHIVRVHEQPSKWNGFRHKIKIQGLPVHLDHGEPVSFEAFGYIGDAVRTQ